ncbi:MAG: PIN domain-containing protein [Candidatus Wildermuthbacteria bacterium]|nr:PIN domain-containing protein [Candidatus Wildermuthbacteria bacterium]
MAGKSERIFADSNYFIALFNERDALSEKANLISEKLEEQDILLCITNLIFLEIVTVTSVRASKQIAWEAGKYLLSSPRIQILHADEDLQRESWEIFQEITDKNISFVDCSIIASMKTLGISKLLTFDQTDFKKLQKQYRFSLYE